ncbi:hypothetical protein PRZ48_010842 [Zasmidium cellare]|uniref:Carbohydrate-binding-like protein n=1 Tax=Zasmidium cellare TaxID=395010 RepID=A0ABR0E9S6_ZASCE|nr:hypothetical protein PRZ48_010842 [Zasmidium cellare]
MKSCILLAAVAGLASAAPQLEKRQYIDYEAAVDDLVPTVTEVPGLKTQTVHYDPTAAISSAAAEATEEPLSQKKRELETRDACDPEPTIANTYNIDVSSPSAFQNDPNAAAAANAAAIPSGYTRNFKALTNTVIGYGYLGYQQISSYDPQQCATRCTALAGCLGFNLFFERAPVSTPGDACPNPAPFANIKCAFWGGPVEAVGALDSNDTRSDFQVVYAGSNGYTTTAVQQISGYSAPTILKNVSINAPLDCINRDTYMGFKLFTSGAYDTRLCTAACESQNVYSKQYPPQDITQLKLCKFITSYLLLKNGVPEGQFCVMYTQAWDQSHGTNDGQWRGDDHYTIQYSFAYGNSSDTGMPVCPNQVSYLQTSGQEFCTSYIHYSAPTSTAVSTAYSTPATSTVRATSTSTVTAYSYTRTTTITGYGSSTSAAPMRRDAPPTATPSTLDEASAYPIDTAAPSGAYVVSVVSSVVPAYTSKVVDTVTSTTAAPQRREVSEKRAAPIPEKRAAPAPQAAPIEARAVATPASASNWPASVLSSACSSVATGTATTTRTTTLTAATPLYTSFTSTTTTTTITTVSTYTVPPVVLSSATAVVGSLNGSPSNYDDSYYALTLPFSIGTFGSYASQIYLGINGWVGFPSGSGTYVNTALPATNMPDTCIMGLWDDLYIYQGTQQGIYYQVSGATGTRVITFEFYTSAFQRPSEYYHFTMTFYEATPGVTLFKYYDVSLSGSSATIGAQKVSSNKVAQYSFNQPVLSAGMSLTLNTTTGYGVFTAGTFDRYAPS